MSDGKDETSISGSLSGSADASLVTQAVKDDREALSELLARHGPAVERSLQIGRPFRSLVSGEDVMQVTYLEAFLRIRHFDTARSHDFRAWLARIAQNNLRDAIRGLERRREPPVRQRLAPPDADESRAVFFDAMIATSMTPSRVLGRAERIAILDAALDALPPLYAEVIRRYDLEELPIAAVAEIVGRSPGAVHMLRQRASEHLREILCSMSRV